MFEKQDTGFKRKSTSQAKPHARCCIQVADPLLRNRPEPLPYPPGSWGPAPAAELAAPDGWLLGQ